MLHFPSAALVTEGERGATANSENLCDRICSRKAGGGLRGFNVLNNDRDEMGLGGGGSLGGASQVCPHRRERAGARCPEQRRGEPGWKAAGTVPPFLDFMLTTVGSGSGLMTSPGSSLVLYQFTIPTA